MSLQPKARVTLLCALLSLYSLIDLLLTLAAMREFEGFHELNPIARRTLEAGFAVPLR